MGSRSCWFSPSIAILTALSLVPVCGGQTSSATQKPPAKQAKHDSLQQHFDAARTFEIGGDQERAAAEYKAFLGEALRSIANARAKANQFDLAAKLYDEALGLTPDQPDLCLDFATMRLREGKLLEAKTLAEKAVKGAPNNAAAQYTLGGVLFQQADYRAAREHLEAAVVAGPTFENGYLLGITYLKLNDLNRAALLFNEMITGLGDTPQIHMYLGRAYREGEFFEQAVEEIKKAIARDPKLKQAHYFLGLAYVGRDGDSGFPAAIPEFQAELKINPDDFRSHYMLGYIWWKQRNMKDAESELVRAASLDPQSPDPLVYLGQLYNDSNRLAEAESTLRKAIALTKDVSRNGYQVNRAHYVLGRILLQTGRREEGEKELKISEEIRRQIPNPAKEQKAQKTASPVQEDAPGRLAETPPAVSSAELKKVEQYVAQLAPQIADAYNNLGVAAAGRKDFAAALQLFQKAGEWNPGLETLDRNLGMAAFYANQYDHAIVPLQRHVQGHPDDVRARAALGLSFYTLANYPKTLETLRPIEKQVDADPGLSYAYAVSLVKTGDYTQGVDRLKSLEVANPNTAEIHVLLGDAFADQGVYGTALEEYRKAIVIDPKQARTHFLLGLALIHQGSLPEAAQELRTALKLDPSDVQTKYHLAFALLQMQQKGEALTLLQEVIRQDPQHADAYYQLGKMQLEQGEATAAISSLETGAKLKPGSDYIHYQLALAYRRDSRTGDAEREMKVYQELKNQRRGASQPN
jgi:tetratricopeptide (TPR) repeat protein